MCNEHRGGCPRERLGSPQPFSSEVAELSLARGMRTKRAPEPGAVLRVPRKAGSTGSGHRFQDRLPEQAALAVMIRTGRTGVGALGFSLTLRAERAAAVSPAEQTKQLKVISLCSHTHHQPLTHLLLAQTRSAVGQDAAGEITRGQDVELMRFGRGQGGGEPGGGERLPASRGPEGGRVSPPRGSLLPKSDHLPTCTPIQDPPPTSSPLP